MNQEIKPEQNNIQNQVPVNSEMVNTANTNNIPSFGESLKNSWKFFCKNWRIAYETAMTSTAMFLVGTIVAVLGVSLQVFGSSIGSWLGILILIISILIIAKGVIIALYGYYVIYIHTRLQVVALDRGESVSVSPIFKPDWKTIRGAIWIFILLTIVPYAGYPLLIIPGLILFVMVYFSDISYFLDNRRGLQALILSSWTVKGYKWKSLFRIIGLGLIMAGIIIPPSLVVAFLVMFIWPAVLLIPIIAFILIPASLYVSHHFFLQYYKSLRVIRGEVSPEYTTKMRKWFKVFAIVGVVFYILINVGDLLNESKKEHSRREQDHRSLYDTNMQRDMMQESYSDESGYVNDSEDIEDTMYSNAPEQY